MNEVCAKMKRLVLGLVLCGLGAFACGNSAVGREVASEVVQKALGVTNVVYRLSTEEAVRAVDEVFAKNQDYRDEGVRRLMKRRLGEGRGEMYTYDRLGDGWEEPAGKVCHVLKLVNLMPEVKGLSHYVYSPSIFYDSASWSADEPEKVSASCVDVRTRYRSLLETVRAFETASVRATEVSREVVADVETVRLLSLTHFDSSAFPDIGDEDHYDFVEEDEDGNIIRHEPPMPKANYLVTLRVRPEYRTPDGFVRFSFPVTLNEMPLTPNGEWLFYRGITLSVGFATSNGVSRVARIDPVLPYPPYGRENIRLYSFEGEMDPETCPYSREDPFGRLVMPEKGVRSLLVNYGDHTLVHYSCETNLLAGFLGSFPDFSATTRVRVWTDGSSARPEYWRDAWFAFKCETDDDEDEDSPWYDSRVQVLPAIADAATDDAYVFSLRGVRFPEVSFRAPATMGDLADFLTHATKPHCGERRSYPVTADASCAERPLRPYAAKDIAPYALLTEICSQNGCGFTVWETNVTICATVRAEDLTPPNLDMLHRELTELGLASVCGATYTNGWFDASVRWADGTWNKEDEMRRDWWVRPVAGVTNRVQILARNCVWWEVVHGYDEKEPRFRGEDEGPVRLRRTIARLIFRLEEDPAAAATVDNLAFALQLHETGFRKEAARIVELLWRNPEAAVRAREDLRACVAESVKAFPTAAAWIAVRQREAAEEKAKKAAKENDDEE